MRTAHSFDRTCRAPQSANVVLRHLKEEWFTRPVSAEHGAPAREPDPAGQERLHARGAVYAIEVRMLSGNPADRPRPRWLRRSPRHRLRVRGGFGVAVGLVEQSHDQLLTAFEGKQKV